MEARANGDDRLARSPFACTVAGHGAVRHGSRADASGRGPIRLDAQAPAQLELELGPSRRRPAQSWIEMPDRARRAHGRQSRVGLGLWVRGEVQPGLVEPAKVGTGAGVEQRRGYPLSSTNPSSGS